MMLDSSVAFLFLRRQKDFSDVTEFIPSSDGEGDP
jgi:hypothetical protein